MGSSFQEKESLNLKRLLKAFETLAQVRSIAVSATSENSESDVSLAAWERHPGERKPVTMLFADIVGFTSASASLTAEFLISELSDIYSAFDEIVERHDCERIKTIGDAYFAVSGIPDPNPEHATNMVRCGLGFIRHLEARNATRDQQWKIRVGIHSGNVVGGIVGTKKYLYDVFGDAVNMASRIETATKPMQVGISAATYDLVKEKFSCALHGPVHLKGKGEEELWFVA